MRYTSEGELPYRPYRDVLHLQGKRYIASTIASRLIVMALIVTGFLSDRLRRSEAAIAHQKAQLESQAQLAGMREDFVSTLTHDLKTPLLGAIALRRRSSHCKNS